VAPGQLARCWFPQGPNAVSPIESESQAQAD
jgi:hypothetical protein